MLSEVLKISSKIVKFIGSKNGTVIARGLGKGEVTKSTA